MTEIGTGNWLSIPKIYFAKQDKDDETLVFQVKITTGNTYKIIIFIDEKLELHTAQLEFTGQNKCQLQNEYYYVYCPKIAKFYLEFENKEKLKEYL